MGICPTPSLSLVTDLARDLCNAIFEAEYNGESIPPQQQLEYIRQAFTIVARRYWQQAITLSDFRLYYTKSSREYTRKPNAPWTLPKTIKLPEVLIQGIVAREQITLVGKQTSARRAA